MQTKINHSIALGNDTSQIAVTVYLRNDFEIMKVFRARNERLTHSSFGTSNDDFSHK
jgi:hypothetical protein